MSTANPTANGSPIPTPDANQGGAEHSSIVEPRPIVETVGSENMFLSPRVLDGGAFSRYSEMLKSIITNASSQGRKLEEFTTDASAMIKRCESTSDAMNKRMQAGVRMLKMIDERATRTDLLLDKVQSSMPDTEAFAAKIDELGELGLAEAHKKIDEALVQAQARVEAAEQRASKAIEESDQHAIRLAELSARVDGQLSELESRIANTRTQTSETLNEIIERTNTINIELNADIDSVLSRTHEAGANLALKIDEASKLTDARLAELSQSIEPVIEAASLAMRTLGMDPQNPVFEDSPLSRIEQLVERGETQMASLDRVYRQLEDLQSQAQGVKAVFGMRLCDAAEELDVLEARKDNYVGPMSEIADKITKLGPDIEEKLEIASTKLTHLQMEQQTLRETIQASSTIADQATNQLTNQSGQLQALLEGSLHKLSTRVEQAGVWLGALIQRAEDLGAALPGAGTMEFGSQQTPSPTPMPIPAPIQTPTTSIPTHNGPTSASDASPGMPIAPQPPCLPIDAISFDGSSMVIEHDPRSLDLD